MIKFKKTVLITLSIIVGLVLTAVIAARILEPTIKKAAVEQINKQLSVPISVGEIEFSILKKFPYASLEFQDVVTAGSKLDGVTENLLEAKKVYLLFNIFDAFSDDLKLKQINIESAKLNMYSGHDGRDNFSIFKDKSNDTSHFNVQLEAVKLNQETNTLPKGTPLEDGLLTIRLPVKAELLNPVKVRAVES